MAAKKRVIKSLDNLSEELQELQKKLYPNGYEGSVSRINNAKNEPIFVFPLETEDSVYLIKVPVTKNSEGGYEVNPSPVEERDNDHHEEEDFSSDDGGYDNDDYDDVDSNKSNREASYDPDFDN